MAKIKWKFSTFEERVAWLVENKKLWLDWYIKATYNEERDLIKFRNVHFNPNRQFLILKMKEAGLFSTRTYWLDVKLKNELYSASKLIKKR